MTSLKSVTNEDWDLYISINSTGFIVLLLQADDVYTLSMMVVFWAAVVFYLCEHTVEVYGTTDKDTLPSTLSSTVTSTALPTVLPTEDESVKLVVRMCLEVSHDLPFHPQLENIFQCCIVLLKVNIKLTLCFLWCRIYLCTFSQFVFRVCIFGDITLSVTNFWISCQFIYFFKQDKKLFFFNSG